MVDSEFSSDTLDIHDTGAEARFPPVSLIVIDHNGKSKLRSLLDDCLTSLLHTDYPNFEILFVDNGSSDHTTDYIERKFKEPRMRVVKLGTNLGYAGAVNLGVQQAKGSFIGVLNNDITAVDPLWLDTLVQFMRKEPSVGIVSPALLHDEKRIDSMGGDANVLMVAWDTHSREEFFNNDHQPIFPVSPPGAAFLFRRDLADKLHNEIFDPDFFAYYEDVLLGFRVNLMGQKIAVLPGSTLHHKRGSSWGLISPEKFFLQRRNAVWTGMMIFDTPQVLALLPVWLTSNLYAGLVYYKTTRNPRFLLSPFKVVLSVIADMRRAWVKHEAFHRESGSAVKALNFSSKLILSDEKMTFARRFALATVNLALRLAGLSKFKITRIERYPLLDPAFLEKNR